MSIWDWVIVFIIGVICLFALIMVFRGWRPISKTPPHIKANIRTEKRLLQSILDDIENNHSDWIAVPYDMGMQREPHLINDKKNMAILISNDQVIIKMNLKAAHKYRESAEETIATTVKGRHVLKFVKTAEGLIDTRGKELSFIEDMLNRRL
jgi:hypothetical protein